MSNYPMYNQKYGKGYGHGGHGYHGGKHHGGKYPGGNSFPFIPFLAGLAISPFLFGSGPYGGYGEGSYGPNFGPNYGPQFGPNFGPQYGYNPYYGSGYYW